MAISNNPSDGVQLVTTPGTAVTSLAGPPDDTIRDNTHTIVILNNTPGTDLLCRWQTSTAAITPATGSVVPGGSALTLSIGSKSQRPTDSASSLYFDSVGVAVTVQITYVNGLVL
jgi:hypothetical protein